MNLTVDRQVCVIKTVAVRLRTDTHTHTHAHTHTGTQATYKMPGPPKTNGAINLWSFNAKVFDNYVTNAAGPAYVRP